MFENLTASLSSALSFFRGKKKLSEENIAEGLKLVRQSLLEADVHFQVAKDFVKRVKEKAVGRELIGSVDPGQQFIKLFHDELTELMGSRGHVIAHADHGPTILMLAGLQGSGKTTTCAKLALHYRRKKKKKALLVAADLQRPAAVDQLKALGKQLAIDVFDEGTVNKGGTRSRPPEVCRRGIEHAHKHGHDFVILDTAGRLHIDDRLMAELEEIVKLCKPHAVILVCDAMLGQDAVNSAKEFHERLPLEGIILTKLDGDTRGGAAMSIRAVTGRPVLYVGVGEKLEDLEEFHPDRMAGRILGMGDIVGLVERAQEHIDEKEAERATKKLMKGRFNFNDFLKQMQMIKKLGSMKKLLGMLPGVGQQIKDIDIDDRQFARLEAMILSMTVSERLGKVEIDIPRRRRIARGSGNDLPAVHQYIKQFKHMQKLFGKMGKGGGLPAGLGMPARKGFRPPKGISPPGGGFPGGFSPLREPFTRVDEQQHIPDSSPCPGLFHTVSDAEAFEVLY